MEFSEVGEFLGVSPVWGLLVGSMGVLGLRVEN